MIVKFLCILFLFLSSQNHFSVLSMCFSLIYSICCYLFVFFFWYCHNVRNKNQLLLDEQLLKSWCRYTFHHFLSQTLLQRTNTLKHIVQFNFIRYYSDVWCNYSQKIRFDQIECDSCTALSIITSEFVCHPCQMVMHSPNKLYSTHKWRKFNYISRKNQLNVFTDSCDLLWRC